ncbi:MAG: molecular chaperone DnaK [Candidatus Pacebacteria bacterium]|nr:molecular chaperone DnaK [Candidatus Paceibacterota bacterium]
MSKILGIDLGTTFSAMAVIAEGGEAKIIENKEGERTTPSVVAISKKGERMVGAIARRQQVTNPENTVFAVKRLIGRRFDDPETKEMKKTIPYQIRKEEGGEGVEIKLGEKWHKPAEISAMVLQKLKKDAEEKIGEKITEAIITCPAYFDDAQRKETKIAGEIAGFNVRRVINEPTAAALAYGLNKKKDHQIVVYDFGGGTFDVSILDVGDDTIEVKGTSGDSHLGGEDFDNRIVNWLIESFKNDHGIDLSTDPLALQRLKEEAEKTKKELSTTMQVDINIPFITSDESGPKHLNYLLTRAKFETMVEDFIDRSIELVKKTIDNSGIKVEEIEEVVLVGGQTRMPKIQERVKEILKKEPNREINPDEVVAVGAAIQGGIMGGDVKDVLLLDVIPLSLGIETLGGKNTTLIEKNTAIPTQKTEVFSTATDNQPSVQIHILQGERAMAQDNKSLGQFILDGIPPAPRGVPQIEVSFDIDANGILNVSAKDKGTEKTQSIRIEGSCGISDEEVERMKKEAEEYAKTDKEKEELIDIKNQADQIAYSSEKMLSDSRDKLPEEMATNLDNATKELRKVQNVEDKEKIKEKMEELNKVAQEAGRHIHEQAQNDQQPKEGEEASTTDEEDKKAGEETQEGDYEEK